MIQKRTFTFLKDIKNNNSKDWLDEHRANYNFAKNDILKLTAELIKEASSYDNSIARAGLEPKKCITRLNRDLRFSNDKTPYKTNYFIILNKDGKKSDSAFYYVHLEPGNSFVGGGVYNPLPGPLRKIRQEIDYAFVEWKEILDDKRFKKYYPAGVQPSGVLKRIPKGYQEDNPAGEFLKMKGFYTSGKLTDEEVQGNTLNSILINYFASVKPLVDYLNRAIAF